MLNAAEGRAPLQSHTRPRARQWSPTAIAAAALLAGPATPDAHAQICHPEQIAKLLDAGGSDNDIFGRAVAVDGDTAVIGVPGDDDNGYNIGSACIYTRDADEWVLQARLSPDDGSPGDFFGTSVAIDGDTVLIGADHDDDNAPGAGAAYVFTRTDGVWTLQAKLLAVGGGEADWFGRSVAIEGDTAVVGAHADDDNGSNAGAVYVFARDGNEWTQQAQILAPDGQPYDYFGIAVDISGQTLIVGASEDDNDSADTGSAYVFVRDSDQWSQQAKLVLEDRTGRDMFGWSVAIDGDRAVVGAHGDDDRSSESGSARVFRRLGTEWHEQAELLAADGDTHDGFGWSVDISGDTILVGNHDWDEFSNEPGAAYVFVRRGGAWIQRAKLLAADGQADARFGSAAALDAQSALIGAWSDDDTAEDAGSAFPFELGCGGCPADVTGEGDATTLDFIVFLNAWVFGNSLADWNEDAEVNTQDFLAYLGDWVAGC